MFLWDVFLVSGIANRGVAPLVLSSEYGRAKLDQERKQNTVTNKSSDSSSIVYGYTCSLFCANN